MYKLNFEMDELVMLLKLINIHIDDINRKKLTEKETPQVALDLNKLSMAENIKSKIKNEIDKS